jgi:hypothetical protein
LWEYDLETFNYEKSYKVVIDRICQFGWIEDWKEMLRFYPIGKIKETIKWSKQMTKGEKDFARLFIQSDILQ